MKVTQTARLGLALILVLGFTLSLTGMAFGDCPEGIVAYWKLDESDGSSGYIDFVGGNNGAGAAEPDGNQTGIVNQAQLFNGTDDAIEVQPSKTFNWLSDDNFTIELWVKVVGGQPANTKAIISRSDSPLFWYIGITTGGLPYVNLNDTGSDSSELTGTTDIATDGLWHHLALVRDEDGTTPNTNYLYVDGVLEDSEVVDYGAGFTSETTSMFIGRLDGFANSWLNGYVDEVAIYDRALDVTEISNHFASGAPTTDYCGGITEIPPAFAPYPEDTVSLWKLDEADGSGTDGYADAFGNNNGAGAAEPDGNQTGIVNQAQLFNGTDDAIEVQPSKTFNWLSDDNFTIELWVKVVGGQPANTKAIISRSDSPLFWYIGITTGGLPYVNLNDTGSDSSELTGTTDIATDGLWHHLALVRDEDGTTPNTNYLYVDGVLEDSEVVDYGAGFTSETASMFIGRLDGFANSWLNGYVDEVAIYDRALDVTEISQHVSAGQSGNGVQSLRPAPTANAGADQSVVEGVTVTLTGSGSTYAGASITSYQWTRTDSTGLTATLSNATAAQPTFTAPDVTAAATLQFALTVTASDGQTSTADTVDIVVSDTTLPTANAGADQSVTEGSAVTLDGSASTAGQGGALTYAWTRTDSTGLTVTLSDAAVAQPTFTAPEVTAAGAVLTFQLIVTENGTPSTADTVNITINDVATSPDADAGADQSVTEGDTVTLDGSGSTAAAGGTLTYAWTQTDSTGITVTLSNALAIQPTFTAPDVDANTTLTFQLAVTEGGISNTDTVDIVVNNSTATGGDGGGGGCFIDSMF